MGITFPGRFINVHAGFKAADAKINNVLFGGFRRIDKNPPDRICSEIKPKDIYVSFHG